MQFLNKWSILKNIMSGDYGSQGKARIGKKGKQSKCKARHEKAIQIKAMQGNKRHGKTR